MRHEDRATARRQIDKKLNLFINNDTFARPARGWIKAIRDALGMTTAQLAARIGVSQPRAVAIEKAEINGAITLDSLERAAHALDCRLVYVLVPKKPLEQLIEERAHLVARQRLESTRHNMALEAQAVVEIDEEKQLERLTQRLIEKASELWEKDT